MLASEHTTLAKGAAGLDGAKKLPRLLGKLKPDLRLASRQQIQPVRDVALPVDHVTTDEGRMDEVLADGQQLVFLQAGENLEAAQVGQPPLAFAPPDRLAMGLVLLRHQQRLLRYCQLHATALQGGEHMHAHRRVGRIVGLRIEHPVAQSVTRVTRTELHQDARWPRVIGNVGNLGSADCRLDGSDHLRRWRIVGQVEPHPAPPRPARDIGPTVYRETATHQLAVGYHDDLAIARPDRRLSPADLRHAAGQVVDADPVAGAQRVVELQGDSGQDVAQRILHGEGEHGGDHRRRRQQARRVEADEVQSRNDEQRVQQQHADVFGDARNDDADARQDRPEDEDRRQPEQRHTRTDDEDLVHHHRQPRIL
ncbi:MAG: hypothetical protein AW07_04432 [Candidatus Accumulibacter sp. SK-11]|nr:MAG: hypothetical protein AW07_04432 [Candidatus Accumulibacter sp. SK-11]